MRAGPAGDALCGREDPCRGEITCSPLGGNHDAYARRKLPERQLTLYERGKEGLRMTAYHLKDVSMEIPVETALEMVERHVLRGEAIIEQQRMLIQRLGKA